MAEEPRELHQSEIDKNVAEAEKLRAEGAAATRKAEAEAEKLDVETAKLRAELVKANNDADREKEKRRAELAEDKHHHHYRFNQSFDNTSCGKLIDQLNEWWRHEDAGHVTITFFSPGGSVFPGLALLDHIEAMRQDGWTFTTICRGYAASMGGILLQAGDKRICGPESYVLIHEISSGAMGKIGELEDEVEFLKLVQKRVNDLFVRKSNGKVTAAKLRAMYRRKDFWLDSEQALRLGIVDEIG